MKKQVLILSILFPLAVFSQKTYEPTWESIDSRPVADWYSEAKFGIFIHWGPYSVPSWSPKGTYEEWYQEWLQSESIFGNGDFTGQEIPEFHRKTYGDNFNYYDFAKLWKAELYDPEQWAELFKKAGAKYVVMTSKHHDGFTLWPNAHAGKVRDIYWNSMETGPRRDLVGDFMKAMKGAGLKAGLYYSLYEWFHPWYQSGNEKFVSEHYHPQFKELVQTYEPEIIYADGEWEQEDSYWRSTELLAWLFNESKVKDYVVINDRWAKGQRHKHGGFYTTEYLRESTDHDHPWEEIRGMGLSFGYNRNEDLEDYNSAKTIILMMVDIISKGGNFCLNVGPRGDGKIPVIMQERLLQIGKWLDINGEAIYGTTRWERPVQWSPGDREYDFKSMYKSYVEGEYILYQTINPLPGKALKEIFFTQKGDDIFAILPKWPGQKLVIEDLKLPGNARISLLANGQALRWRQRGKNIEITLPVFNPNDWSEESQYAYVIKIER